MTSLSHDDGGKFLTKDEVKTFPLFHQKRSEEEMTQERKKIDCDRLLGVTTILSRTKSIQDQLILGRWKKKMIREMGEEQFELMQKETLAQGKELHEAIGWYLAGDKTLDEIRVSSKTVPLWKSVQHILKDMSNVHVVEGEVTHGLLGYRGYVDCVAEYKGELYVIDWKTSKKIRKSLDECFDDPTQISAYAGAYNHMQDNIKVISVVCIYSTDSDYTPNVNTLLKKSREGQITLLDTPARMKLYIRVSKGMVVKIYHNGRPATAFPMNTFTLEYHWNKWLARLTDHYYKEI